jgi:hypothetical protein
MLAAIPAMAAKSPAPYLGLNLHVNSPTADFANTDLVDKQAGARTGWGGEADLGIDSRPGSVYVGYSWGRHDADARGQDRNINDWTVSRGILGARLHIFGTTESPIVPIVGGGATIGNSRYTARVSDDGGITYVDRKQTSENSIGWFLEGGAILRSSGPLSVLGSLQYHNFNADFKPVLDIDRVKVSYVTFQLGIRYNLGSSESNDHDNDNDHY